MAWHGAGHGPRVAEDAGRYRGRRGKGEGVGNGNGTGTMASVLPPLEHWKSVGVGSEKGPGLGSGPGIGSEEGSGSEGP